MIDLQNIQKRLDKANDIKDALFCHALGFNVNIDDFMEEHDNDEIPIDQIVHIAIEIAKGGYALTDEYRLTDEYVLRYFCITSMLMIYITLPNDAHTFTSIDYLCDLFDNNYYQFELLANNIESEVFQHYYELLLKYTEYLISPLKGTLEALIIAFLEKSIEGGYVEEISEIVTKDINDYINHNTYDEMLIAMMEND